MMILQWSCGCAYMSHYENVPFEVPEGWSWCTLDELTTSIGDGLHGTPKFDDNGEYYFVNGNNLDGIISIKKETKRTTIDEYTKQGLKFNSQTIFVSINGTLGNIAFYNNEPIVLGKSACYINLLDSISKEYIATILRCQYFINYCRDTATGSTIKNVPLAAMRTLFIPIPSYQEQLRIVDEVEKLLSLVDLLDENTNEIGNAITVARSKILDLAIHGKLVPQDANDEPASELLKRINSKAVASCDNPHYENMPSNWVCTTMGSIFQHNTGKALNKSVSVEGTLQPYLTTSNVYWNTFDLSVVKEMRFKESEIKKCTVRKGDLLVCEGGDIGRSAIWNKDYSICIQNHLHRLRPKGDIVPLLYLYFIMYLKLTNNLEGKGIGLQGFSSGLLDKLEVPLPPYNEQIRIVNKIQEAFNTLDFIAESLI